MHYIPSNDPINALIMRLANCAILVNGKQNKSLAIGVCCGLGCKDCKRTVMKSDLCEDGIFRKTTAKNARRASETLNPSSQLTQSLSIVLVKSTTI